jgi:ATP-dependent Lon protease
MPASRWNSNFIDLLNTFDGDDLTLRDLIFKSIQVIGEKDGNTEEQGVISEDQDDQVPLELPILPLRGLVVYPETAVPLTIGQPRSIRLVDDVVSDDKQLIGLVASKNPELDNPEPGDLYTVGTIAVVHRMFRAPDGTIRLLVQGNTRFKLDEFVQHPCTECS